VETHEGVVEKKGAGRRKTASSKVRNDEARGVIAPPTLEGRGSERKEKT
jgi:hypothetical protein